MALSLASGNLTLTLSNNSNGYISNAGTFETDTFELKVSQTVIG
jgi:hypothetical protein